MTTYYHTLEEALKRAKTAGKRPGCRYCGIVLKNGRRGFAVYKDGEVIEQSILRIYLSLCTHGPSSIVMRDCYWGRYRNCYPIMGNFLRSSKPNQEQKKAKAKLIVALNTVP